MSADILKDLDRTFPGHRFFNDASTQASLERMLTAFAVRNPDIGYCQSLNFVAGMLLLHMDEEKGFWIMDCLINEILPTSYYWCVAFAQAS